ncbi:MAG: alpha/beta hydrolase [Chloroflexota bacterium]|jgi:pimeloyl-ACP methyl ester carboxylesterase
MPSQPSQIPYERFGDRGPLLHFAHANAYPPGVYRELLSTLANRFRVLATHERPLWPGSQPESLHDWSDIADDMIRFFDQRQLSDAIGVGHSLGAVATMIASLKRPALFRALVLIEPVFLPQNVVDLLIAGAKLDNPYEIPYVQIARNRRAWWPSQEATFAHYRGKEVFARLSDETLWNYVRYGTVEDQRGGVRLRYSPEWEAQIYALPPTGVWELIPLISRPTLAMRGRESDTLSQQSWSQWQALQPQAIFEEYAGAGHLLPIELAAPVADSILAFVDSL